MSINQPKTPMSTVELQIRELEFLDLIKQFKFMQTQDHELTARRIELTQDFDTAFKKSRELYRIILAAQVHTQGEGRQSTKDNAPFIAIESKPVNRQRPSKRHSAMAAPLGEFSCH